jgi:hypothetical protein
MEFYLPYIISVVYLSIMGLLGLYSSYKVIKGNIFSRWSYLFWLPQSLIITGIGLNYFLNIIIMTGLYIDTHTNFGFMINLSLIEYEVDWNSDENVALIDLDLVPIAICLYMAYKNGDYKYINMQSR